MPRIHLDVGADTSADHRNLVTKLSEHDSALDALEGGGGAGVNVQRFGALGNGITDDRAAIQAAIDAVAAIGGGLVYFPPGVYVVGRNGGNSYSLLINALNITLRGELARSWLQHPVGMPNAQVAIVQVNDTSHVLFDRMSFDGNWGNAVTQIASTTSNLSLPTGTLTVDDTSQFPSSGTLLLNTWAAGVVTQQTVTYTAKTATTFTGCSGGTGALLPRTKVGILDSNTGLNHVSQVDPKNHGIFVRGSTDVIINQCRFRDIYGDGVWLGASLSNNAAESRDVWMLACSTDITARNGVSLGGPASRVRLVDCVMTNIHSTAFDTEAPDGATRDIVLSGSHLGGWWNPSNPGFQSNSPLSIVGGGGQVDPSPAIFARSYRVTDCTIEGGVQIANAVDTVVRDSRIVCDFTGMSFCPIILQGAGDDVWITDNEIYVRTLNSSGVAANGGIAVASYNTELRPKGVHVARNRIHAKNGAVGIQVTSPGGTAGTFGSSTSVTRSDYGLVGGHATATTLQDTTKNWTPGEFVGATVQAFIGSTPTTAVITGNNNNTLNFASWSAGTPSGGAYGILGSLKSTGAGWTTNQWQGFTVVSGGFIGVVTSNSSDTLNLYTGSDGISWRTAQGDPGLVPAVGGFVIRPTQGVVHVVDNEINLADDGNGAGGIGLQVTTTLAGSYVEAARNTVIHPAGPAIKVTANLSAPFASLELVDNVGRDFEPTTSLTSVVNLTLQTGTIATDFTRLVLRGNRPEGVAVPALSGVVAGQWLVEDGTTQRWAGFGAPAIVAPKGSAYYRVDGGAGTTLYVNETGTSTWAPK